ncbi:AP-4 complex subunit sigma-like [Olea europaea var. sylvestris]|uniref:AP-4 complex subunit sigma-like n=1 Tax=Olea europaea var. sylvestris TaxID=158386 RepID=UPI000C1D7B35|nr:AP-4 complex subunit sigma-like [Olea europaea var. sylvestris]
MGIRFILMVNKQGQTRLAQYYEYLTLEERRALEGEIVRKCLARNEQQVCVYYLILQCELDIMFHLEKAHFMLEEMVMNGCIVETSKANILSPIQLMDKAS